MLKPLSVATTVALTTLISLSTTTTANAQVTVTTTPFLGMLTETFESFQNYNNQPGFYLPNPTDLFGGAASLAGATNLIYEPSAGAPWNLIDNGDAGVADGTKGMAVDNRDTTATITFDDTISDFGGFFNAGQGGLASDTVIFSFFDVFSVLIDTENIDVAPSGGGALNFYRFSSTTPVKVVTITGDFTVMDNLRVNLAPTGPGGAAPEPASLALFAFIGGAVVIARRRRRTA